MRWKLYYLITVYGNRLKKTLVRKHLAHVLSYAITLYLDFFYFPTAAIVLIICASFNSFSNLTKKQIEFSNFLTVSDAYRIKTIIFFLVFFSLKSRKNPIYHFNVHIQHT